MQTWSITYKNELSIILEHIFYNKTRGKINQFDILTYLEESLFLEICGQYFMESTEVINLPLLKEYNRIISSWSCVNSRTVFTTNYQ